MGADQVLFTHLTQSSHLFPAWASQTGVLRPCPGNSASKWQQQLESKAQLFPLLVSRQAVSLEPWTRVPPSR